MTEIQEGERGHRDRRRAWGHRHREGGEGRVGELKGQCL